VDTGLVDRLVVVDSGSVDETVPRAEAAGAVVVEAATILPAFGPVAGKGDVLWRSLAVCDEDIIVWLDSDTRNFDTHFVTSLVAPLLKHPDLGMVKAFYDRPLVAPTGLVEGGARVTELVARPLINLLWPELSGFIQPLSGEYAIRRELALEVPFLTGYAVDLGLLLDVYEVSGLERMAQADLGVRIHRNQPLPSLGRMASQILQGAFRRLEESGRMKLVDELDTNLVQFAGHEPEVTQVTVEERPPMTSVLGR
jgi:glucosyl-3-phosphoglycerate synthase